MAFKRKSGASHVDITTLKRRSGAAWVDVESVKRRVSGAWVTVWQALTFTAGGNVSGSQFRNEPAVATLVVAASPNPAITVNTTGYTVSWARVSGDTTIAPSSTTAISPQFSATLAKNTSKSGVWRCTISKNGFTATRDVSISLTYTTDI